MPFTVTRRPYPPSIATRLRQQDEAEKNKRMSTALHDMPTAIAAQAAAAKKAPAKKKPAAKKAKR